MPVLTKPSWLSSSDLWLNQGEKYAPVLTLPDNRVFGPVQKRKDVTPESIIGRVGVTGVMNYSAPVTPVSGGPGYSTSRHGFHHANDVKNALGMSNGQSNLMTRDQVRSVAATYPIMPIEGNDFGESDFAFAPDSDQAKWWYEKRKEMYANAGLNPTGIARKDYGHHGCTIGLQGSAGPWHGSSGAQVSPTDTYFRGRYASVAAARSGVGYFNQMLGSTRYEDLVGYNVKNYAETADYARTYYQKRYCIEIMGKGMGKVGGLGPGFLVYNDWAKIEGIGGYPMASINNEHYTMRRIDNPAGYVKTGVHAQVDYEWQVGCALINGFLYSDGYTTFDIAVRFGVDPSKMAPVNIVTPENSNKISCEWLPDTQGVAAPVSSDGFNIEPGRWHDAGYEAAYYYSQFDRTSGVGWAPLAYRFEGSETWIEPPSDGASILEHAAAFDGPNSNAQGARRGRPTVDGRVKNSAFDFVAFDASRGKMYRENIIVRAPNGQLFQSAVQGCKVNAHRETLS